MHDHLALEEAKELAEAIKASKAFSYAKKALMFLHLSAYTKDVN